MNLESLISSRLSLPTKSVSAVLNLLNGGATIPFIARYRKEATDGFDEVDIECIDLENKKLIELVKRKGVILERLNEIKVLSH